MTVNQQDVGGRLPENILTFCRTLRVAGLPVGTGQVIDALHAVAAAGLRRRDDVCQALRSVLVTDPRHFALFQQAFYVYFRNPRLLERMLGMLLPNGGPGTGERQAGPLRRLLEAMTTPGEESAQDGAVDADRSASWSYREVLRRKDFEQMTLEEQRAAAAVLRAEIGLLQEVRTRRFAAGTHGQHYDLRRSMHTMMRNNGQLVELARKRRTERPPDLVLIADISGSMSLYSRLFLHFAHALRTANRKVHAFTFGTRLTNISRRLVDSDPDGALAAIALDVSDWDGGTRIAECLEVFNRRWSRRVLSRDGVVILLSDGLERDPDGDLSFQMQRLRRSCRQLVWLNPMLRYAAFEPRAAGIRSMLPHVDVFLPAHNVDSLLAIVAVLNEAGHAHRHGRGGLLAGASA